MFKTDESIIERGFIKKLEQLKYVYRSDIRDLSSLENNFREKFEALNRVTLTDNEFTRLLEQIVTPNVYEAAVRLRNINSFERDDGTQLNYTLVNIKDWCKNSFEVIHQLRINTKNSYHRYDVLLLINGLPVTQIELKTLTISPNVAMEQIVRYKNDPGNGYGRTLLCFLQLFIVSNQTNTWYFANNNSEHFAFHADQRFLPIYQFADESNRKITHLDDFANTFLRKCTLGETISRYMVLVATEEKLMMMRPYQVYAVKAIVDRIKQGAGNGYIWHTTGSGKTLTSFKASTLLKDDPNIDKCLFVVDRKDLDRQTREEFNRFQAGCVEENTNTKALVERLLSDDYADKVIVTTIQKLGIALGDKQRKRYRERLAPLRNKRVVFIFDECHRSQFGKNHDAIRDFFPKAQLFGFTGTPIFEENAVVQQIEGTHASHRTTEDVFEQLLHAYTITHAIEDRNVLRFHVDYYSLVDPDSGKMSGDLLSKQTIVDAILDKHHAATAGRRFNALFATASINDAIRYFSLFKTTQAERQLTDPDYRPLQIACVFSPPAEGNADIQQIQEDLPQEKADNRVEPNKKKAALIEIIADYNARFDTSHTIQEFDLYYQDVQKRIKDQQYVGVQGHTRDKAIDITIVVDMLLTGFDAKYLNTLYVDKKLKYHGLIQAFSRTNRVLNDTKPYGNVLDFREQTNAVDEAIRLFSGDATRPAKEIWLVESADIMIERFEKTMNQVDDFMASQGLETRPEEVLQLQGDTSRLQFTNLFKEVQRVKTQLDQYTDLTEAQQAKVQDILPTDTHRAFRGVYIDIAQRLKKPRPADENVWEERVLSDEEREQLEFEFVLFASAVIDYDYIMGLLAKDSHLTPEKQKFSRDQLLAILAADAQFIDEIDDIREYVNALPLGEALEEHALHKGYERFKDEKKMRMLSEIAERHDVAFNQLREMVERTLRRRIFDAERVAELFEPLELGWKERGQRETKLMKELSPLLTKYADNQEISGLGVY